MTLEIDNEVHAAYVEFSDAPVEYTSRLDANRLIDYDQHGNPVGVEFLAIHRGVDLTDIPHQEQLAGLFEAQDIRVYA